MVTELNDGTFDFCETLTDAEDALAREMLERASAKWPLRVMHILAEAKGPLRFSRVLERVEGISQKVLTQTLRTLEADGLVTRTLYPQVPPRVEYELTPLGGELLVEVVGLWQWIANRLPDFEAARKPKGQTENGPEN
ncbi:MULTISPECIES: winged helix-turn-helix transcriptional regulator [unclassified Rhizobium]|jgi:DNA-binding HxlR family transcriptional regulator|uniref:winged helix-turn-helix transcriptional regulator n=1 Tax=unclassified Rhizobium TaxID=2613769 RepID=UPI000DDB69AE|nr:helix-turn-helix domain-containing protein [Rhizobium sp. UBA1881]